MSNRILIIEDDDSIANFLTKGLREEGFVVVRVSDGLEGWHELKMGNWNIVLLDWWLPTVDGLALLKRYRVENALTPVIFLTARDAVPERIQGLDEGADDYLCKPFAFGELLARIRALLRRTEQVNGASLTYQDLRIDLATQRSERAGKPLNLTTKEFSLLGFLLRHPGEVLTRERIYQQVWDECYDGKSNTLEVHVVELRRKLEALGSRLIHTIRNRGYVFGKQPGKVNK